MLRDLLGSALVLLGLSLAIRHYVRQEPPKPHAALMACFVVAIIVFMIALKMEGSVAEWVAFTSSLIVLASGIAMRLQRRQRKL